MRKRKFVIGKESANLLEIALTKRLPLTVTNKDVESNWQVYKTHILSLQGRRMVIAMPNPQANGAPMEPIQGQEIAVTFKKGYNKCLFVTRIISQGRSELEPGNFVASVTLYVPEQIEKIQRRTYERTDVPEGEPVSVTFWSTSQADHKFHGELLNLSAGGVGVNVTGDQVPRFIDDQQCQVQFVPLPGQEPVIALARFRHVGDPDENDCARLGFQFIALEATEEGRNLIRRIGRVVTIYDRRNQISNGNYIKRR